MSQQQLHEQENLNEMTTDKCNPLLGNPCVTLKPHAAHLSSPDPPDVIDDRVPQPPPPPPDSPDVIDDRVLEPGDAEVEALGVDGALDAAEPAEDDGPVTAVHCRQPGGGGSSTGEGATPCTVEDSVTQWMTRNFLELLSGTIS